jgi:hypothetical protein
VSRYIYENVKTSPVGPAEPLAQKLAAEARGAEALTEKTGFIAALKALRHPKTQFFKQTVKPCSSPGDSIRGRRSSRRRTDVDRRKTGADRSLVPGGFRTLTGLADSVYNWGQLGEIIT